MKTLHILFASLALTALAPCNTWAQVSLTAEQAPVLLSPFATRNVTWKAQTVTIPMQKNVDIKGLTSDANWLTARVAGNKVLATVSTNENTDPRTGTLTIEAEGITRNVVIAQEGSHMEDDVMGAYEFKIFADPLCTQLREGVTQDDINKENNLFVRTLAQRIYDGTYDTTFRTGTFECLPDPAMVGKAWGTGKSYDIIQGVTGIMVRPGRFIVAVDGVPEEGNFTARLCVYTWKVPEGEYCKNQNFKLKNGLNILESTLTDNGLAYISYYSETPDDYSPIRIHILDGIQNGYLTSDMSNDSCHAMCEKAKYPTIDLLSERVHSVWETEALMTYTKGKYRKMMNTMDTLLCWVHRLTGLEKYNLVPKNKSLAYVNYNYYMYQGGLGVSFKYDQQFRTLNPDRLLRSDSDCIWGYSHEWGHQHQISPYFCWAGMSETTNNMNSVYNVLHLGYRGDNVHTELGIIRNWFLTSSRTDVSPARKAAYADRAKFSWNPKMYAMYESMADSTMHKRSENFERAQATPEAYPNSYTMFWTIHEYMTKNVNPDFTPDLYQAMRETNRCTDKYAILAAAQNTVAGKWNEYKEKYPTSCWVTDEYINNSSSKWDNSVPYIMNFIRQASFISGWNMFDIYDQLGFMRTIALCCDDYGKKYYCMTPEMKAEFRADMQALVDDGTLQPAPEGILSTILSDRTISSYPWADIPN